MSPAVRDLLQQAQHELARRNFAGASRILTAALAAAPDCVPALGMAGVAAQLQGRHPDAVPLFRRALAVEPQDARLYAGLGMSLFETGDMVAAVASLRRACELAPGVAAGWYNLGRALKLQLRTDEAIAALERSLKLDASHVSARLTLADAQASIGQVDAAAAGLRRLLGEQPDQARAWFALANLKVVPFTRHDVELLRHQFARGAVAAEDHVLYGFVLARALEDQGDYAAAFDVLREANALQRRSLQWSAAEHRAHVAILERTFSQPLPEPVDRELGREVIFIASIPRSGSTLVEQILASHASVNGANEITDLWQVLEDESRRKGSRWPAWVAVTTASDWHRLGEDYLARTARWRARKPCFTDKNLVTWKHVGAALAMLPGARVVIVRREPIEVCLACYRQWFASGTQFAYDLDELVDYCADFERLTRFWLQRYPHRVWRLDYETLVADPEPTIRRLLEFCRLPFDAACLVPHRTARTIASAASAAQVRQPMHGAVSRAVPYGRKLDGLRARLRAAGLGTAG